VVEKSFFGKEKDFTNSLKTHFKGASALSMQQKSEVGETWDISGEHLETALQHSSNFEIVPITLPSKGNKYRCVNAYIDAVGRVRNLGTNARASRVCGTNIRGDCFVSSTFDDETDFKRIDFSQKDFESFLANPPQKEEQSMARFSQTQDLLTKMQGSEAEKKANDPLVVASCSSCGATGESLRRCKCTKAFYCNQACQRADWKFHKRICGAVAAN